MPLPTLAAATQFLVQYLQQIDAPFIVFDGLNEIFQENQPTVLSFINTVLRKHSKIKIFVTSRAEEYWIKKAMEPHRSLHLSSSCNQNDMIIFVQDYLDKLEDPSPLVRDERLKKVVIDALVAKAQGM